MKRLNKIIIKVLVLLLFMMSVKTPVFANSAQTHWSGTDSTGTIILEEDCPIIVEKELLTFDIQEFPESYYKEADEFLKYSGKVTAKYTFYNPADYTVTATLAFPFGGIADYGDIYDYENEKHLINIDSDKYDITVDEKVIDKQLRHTLMYYGGQFELEKDLNKLHDGYMEDSFYKPDLQVTKYTYIAKDVDMEEHNAATAGFLLTDDNINTRLYLESQSGGSTTNQGIMCTTWVDMKKEFSVYAIGDPLKDKLDWKFYHNGACDKEIDGTMELVSTDTLTLKEFVLSKYDPKSSILDYDWYNAIVTSFKYHEWTKGAIHSAEVDLDVSDMLMRWYQYEITLEPNQRIVNTVTAPIYPSIDGDYDPAIFEYTYLLSPAKTWKEFGNLDIVINTPYYLIENSIEGFEYKNPGYELHLTGLPEGELEFTLCSKKEALPARKKSMDFRLIFLAIVMIPVVILILRRDKNKGDYNEKAI